MIIFKDKLNEGVELASDTYPQKLDEDGVFLELTGKYVTEGEQDFDIGANPSQEELQETCEKMSKQDINIVLANNLQQVPDACVDKNVLKVYFKAYLKKLAAKLKEDHSEDEVKEWQGKCQRAVPKLLKTVGDCTFYTGGSLDVGEVLDGNGMLVFCRWEGETPVLCFFQKGLVDEKV